MPMKISRNHQLIWCDLLRNIDGTSWFELLSALYYREHGYSNYHKCKRRDHLQVRRDVYLDSKVDQFLRENTEQSKEKINKILDEMCHLLTTQKNPTRKLKFGGFPFLKCITKVYSNIYVLNHLFPVTNDCSLGKDLFKEQYLQMSKELPVVILPTHRSYMDFLFISYIMFIHELPLPIVATGDNFKAMGKYLTDFLKGTGAFLIRRNAHNKKDIEPEQYFNILRAYVHSILSGGENPLEFFMEGTRTRSGQVLRPKTGLLSMVVDTFIDKLIDDVYILPVTINYQRPIEEQLYIAETTPQLNLTKPKESAKNLLTGFTKIMKRKYGKVYVRFIEPFKLSSYYAEWKRSDLAREIENSRDNDDEGKFCKRAMILQEFTNSLASRVCLAQAYCNILMPFNLLAYSLMSRSFFSNSNKNGSCSAPPEAAKARSRSLAFELLMKDYYLVENLLIISQPKFVPGWKSHLDIFDDFNIDRDGIIRATDDRKSLLFDTDAITFHTMQYYGNQVMQILLPISICLIITSAVEKQEADSGNNSTESEIEYEKVSCKLLAQYKRIRFLLSKEFLADEISIRQEFEHSSNVIRDNQLSYEAKQLIVTHLIYFFKCYSKLLKYFEANQVLDKVQFFAFNNDSSEGKNSNGNLYISKDMLKNMVSLLLDLEICNIFTEKQNGNSHSVKKPETIRVRRVEEKYELVDRVKLLDLIAEFEKLIHLANKTLSQN